MTLHRSEEWKFFIIPSLRSPGMRTVEPGIVKGRSCFLGAKKRCGHATERGGYYCGKHAYQPAALPDLSDLLYYSFFSLSRSCGHRTYISLGRRISAGTECAGCSCAGITKRHFQGTLAMTLKTEDMLVDSGYTDLREVWHRPKTPLLKPTFFSLINSGKYIAQVLADLADLAPVNCTIL